MASITLTVIVDTLDNEELDAIPDQVNKLLVTATQESKLAGKIDSVEELDREEDEKDEEENED